MANEEAGRCGRGSGEESPKSKVKFLCSYAGKILPRPSDSILKYVGGETRVVAVSRDISFSELMKKLNRLTEREMVLKYQIIPEDLDTLVSVKSDEDLKHMIDEHDRQESAGIPKLIRTFLFLPNPVFVENQVGPLLDSPSSSTEQRYIEAVNTKLPQIVANRPLFSISTSSSPKSDSPEANGHDDAAQSPQRRPSMNKARSSPNICSHHCTNNNNNNIHYSQQHSHGYYLSHSQYQHPHTAYFNCRPTLGNDNKVSLGWGAPSHGISQFYLTRHNSGGSGCGRCSCREDCGGFRCGYMNTNRESSVPQSPWNHGFRL